MQDLEHNMDDLFRTAADHYPLKGSESKWDDLAGKLRGNPIIPHTSQAKNNIRKMGVMSVFILSALVAGGIIIIKYAEQGHKNNAATFQKQVKKNAVSNAYTENGNIKGEPIIIYKEQGRKDESHSGKNISHINNNKGADINNKSLVKTEFTYSLSGSVENKSTEDPKPPAEKRGLSITPITIREKDSQQEIILQIGSISNRMNLMETDKSKKNNSIESMQGNDHAQGINMKQMKPGRNIYFGMTLGPSFSEVKYQGLKKTGFNIGFIAGYKLSKNISIESGLLFSKKYYFSDGKYFNMDKVRSSMPTGMEVLNLDGSSNAFELPVGIKYNVFHKSNAIVFSTAGISSSIMLSENNTYRTSTNGVRQNLTSSYKNPSGYFAVSFDFGVGYESRIRKIGNIRIGPYMQIPLKGTGVGALPVISSGLHIAFTRFAH